MSSRGNDGVGRGWWDRLSRRSTFTDILVVCTANVCRSRYVAALLADLLPEATVRSAGTYALVGEAPAEPITAMLRKRGLIDQGTARQLTSSMVRGAELILTATRAQRSEVISLHPAAAQRTFTIKEFARTGGAIHHEARDHDDDLDDPFGGDEAAYTRMFAEADEVVRVIVDNLGR